MTRRVYEVTGKRSGGEEVRDIRPRVSYLRCAKVGLEEATLPRSGINSRVGNQMGDEYSSEVAILAQEAVEKIFKGVRGIRKVSVRIEASPGR